MISTLELVKGFINSHHGWAVADQFEDSYDGEYYYNFGMQNHNALQYIHEILQELVESDVLSDSALDDLKTYLDYLKTYLGENS